MKTHFVKNPHLEARLPSGMCGQNLKPKVKSFSQRLILGSLASKWGKASVKRRIYNKGVDALEKTSEREIEDIQEKI